MGLGHVGGCALLHAQGSWRPGETLRPGWVVGGTFVARLLGECADGVLTEVAGTAYKTGEHRFSLDPRDKLGTGFLLR